MEGLNICTHSLTDKTPDSGSGAGGSIPSGCTQTDYFGNLAAPVRLQYSNIFISNGIFFNCTIHNLPFN